MPSNFSGATYRLLMISALRKQRAADTLTGTIIQSTASYATRHPGWAAAALLPIYIWLVLPTAFSRRLWHDELFTYHIARAASWSEMLEMTRKVDLNPPLSYILTRLSIVFGAIEPISYRLPELLAFGIASFALFQFVNRHTTAGYGAVSMLLLWWTPFVYYASEARPYALLLAFSAVMVSAWDRATLNHGRRAAALTMLAAGTAGLLLSHVFGVLTYAAFLGAEFVRTWQRRKIDWPIWTALLLPSLAMLTYMPLFRLHSSVLYPEAFQASIPRAFVSYEILLAPILRPILVCALCAVIVPSFFQEPDSPKVSNTLGLPLIVLLILLFLIPLAENLFLLRTGAGFFDRYGMCVLIPLCVGPPLIAAFATKNNRYAGSASAVCLAIGYLFAPLGGPQNVAASVSSVAQTSVARKINRFLLASPNVTAPWLAISKPVALQACDSAPVFTSTRQFPGVQPIVMSSALTFLETDHSDGDVIGYRMFFLTNPEAAARISHSTLFESYGDVKKYFPVRGEIASYQNFRHKYSSFIVVGTYGYPEEWIIRQLRAENIPMRVLGRFGPYQECVLQVGEGATWLKPQSTRDRSTMLSLKLGKGE